MSQRSEQNASARQSRTPATPEVANHLKLGFDSGMNTRPLSDCLVIGESHQQIGVHDCNVAHKEKPVC